MVTYLTFRAKYCPQPSQEQDPVARSTQLNLLYRIHIFNFLFSLFTLATGYVELTRNLAKHNYSFTALFTMEMVSLAAAHVVLLVYLCCPRSAMHEDMLLTANEEIAARN